MIRVGNLTVTFDARLGEPVSPWPNTGPIGWADAPRKIVRRKFS